MDLSNSERLVKEATDNQIPLTCDSPLWVLCVFVGDTGGLLGRQRLFLSSHCELMLMVLSRPRTPKVRVGGSDGCTPGKSIFFFFFLFNFVILSLYTCGVDITCYKQNRILEIAL